MRILRSQEEIMATWNGDIDKSFVSICCTAYNHEHFIEDALEGFLIQETNFPFEILIHDDASMDKTADIIHEYERKYPKIIKAIYQTENQFSKNNKPMDFLRSLAKSRYIAACEGDDYWLDPTKIQKQIDFLEENPEFVISSHDAFIVGAGGNIISDSKLPKLHKRDFKAYELQQGKAWLLTMNWVYRNVLFENIPERKMVKNGDTFFTIVMGEYGDSHHHKDIKNSGYRFHENGIWSSLSRNEKLEELINTYYWIYRYYKRKNEKYLSKLFMDKLVVTVIRRNGLVNIFKSMLRYVSMSKYVRKFTDNA